MLQVEELTVQYGDLTIVDKAAFSVQPNQWLMVVGPNGAGKSTLVNAVMQSVPYTGRVLFHGRSLQKQKPAAIARQMGMLMQNHTVSYSFTVEEVVRLGRYAWSGGLLAGQTALDDEKVAYALDVTGMQALRGQSVLTLSGGELQRAFLAQVIAQDPALLILDEPANHLDLVYQKQMFEMLSRWLRQPGRAVVSVVHDLSLAKAYGTHALLMDRGKVVAFETLAAALTAQNLNRVYSMDVASWMQGLLSQWRHQA